VRDTVITFELEPPSAEEMAQRILAAQARHAWLVMEEGGALLGYAHAGPHSPAPPMTHRQSGRLSGDGGARARPGAAAPAR
jgi:L-amino acid N-acyltransferase YncA